MMKDDHEFRIAAESALLRLLDTFFLNPNQRVTNSSSMKSVNADSDGYKIRDSQSTQTNHWLEVWGERTDRDCLKEQHFVSRWWADINSSSSYHHDDLAP